jgi:hypothetical protein
LAPYGPPRRVIRGQNFSTDAVLSARDPNVTPLEHRLSNVEQGAVLGDPWFTGNDPFPNVPTTDASGLIPVAVKQPVTPSPNFPQGVSTYEEPTPADLGHWYGSPYVQPEAVADDPYFDPTVNPGSAYLADPSENRWADSGEWGYGRLRHQFTTPPGTPIPFVKGPSVPWQSMGQPAPSDQWISGAPLAKADDPNWDRWRPPSERDVLLGEMPDDYIDKAFHPGNPQWKFMNDPFLDWEKLMDEGSGINTPGIKVGMRDPGKGPYDIKEGSDLYPPVTTKTPADNPSTLEQWMGMRFTDDEKNSIRGGKFWETPRIVEWAKDHLDRLGEAGTAVRKGIIGETTGDIEGAKGLGAFTRNLGENMVGLSDELGKLIEVEGGRASIKGFTPKNPTLTGLLQIATINKKDVYDEDGNLVWKQSLSEIDKQKYGDLQPGALIVLGAYAGTPVGQAIFGLQLANQLKDFVQQVFNVSTFKKADYSGGLFSDVTEFTGSLIRPISRLVLNQILKRIKSDLPDDASMRTVFQELMSKDQVEDPRQVLDEQSTLAITPDPRFEEVGNIGSMLEGEIRKSDPIPPLPPPTSGPGSYPPIGSRMADVVDVDYKPEEEDNLLPTSGTGAGNMASSRPRPLPADVDVKQLSTEELLGALDETDVPRWSPPNFDETNITKLPTTDLIDLIDSSELPDPTPPPSSPPLPTPDPTHDTIDIDVPENLGGFPAYTGPKPPKPEATRSDDKKGDEFGGDLDSDFSDIPEKETVTLTEWTISDRGVPQKTGNTYTIDRYIISGGVDTDAQGNATVRGTYEPLEDSLKRPLDSNGKPIIINGEEAGFQLGAYVKPGEQPKGSQKTYVTSDRDLRNTFELYQPNADSIDLGESPSDTLSPAIIQGPQGQPQGQTQIETFGGASPIQQQADPEVVSKTIVPQPYQGLSPAGYANEPLPDNKTDITQGDPLGGGIVSQVPKGEPVHEMTDKDAYEAGLIPAPKLGKDEIQARTEQLEKELGKQIRQNITDIYGTDQATRLIYDKWIGKDLTSLGGYFKDKNITNASPMDAALATLSQFPPLTDSVPRNGVEEFGKKMEQSISGLAFKGVDLSNVTNINAATLSYPTDVWNNLALQPNWSSTLSVGNVQPNESITNIQGIQAGTINPADLAWEHYPEGPQKDQLIKDLSGGIVPEIASDDWGQLTGDWNFGIPPLIQWGGPGSGVTIDISPIIGPQPGP